MNVPLHEAESEEKTTFTVLVTGANSGLGFSICCRLIDEFLATRPPSQSLHLLFSTRDAAKRDDTLHRLNAHFQRTLRTATAHPPNTPGLASRLKLEGVLTDLTQLLTVKALATQLLRRGTPLDAVIWNAGIPGWTGIDWPRAIWHMCTDLVHACTYPDFNLVDVGLRAPLQTPRHKGAGATTNTTTTTTDDEPALGQVFLANVFGHYLLTHWLAPLFTPSSRLIWTSSVSALPHSLDLADPQCLRSRTPYEGTKRLTDLLALTSALPSTAPYTARFLGPAKPPMLVAHPGVVATSISGLGWFLCACMLLAFWAARLLGSPWHAGDPYKGAIAAVFLALAPYEQLLGREAREGKGKWGSATDVWGQERVARTEVEGWGYGGVVGRVPPGCVVSRSVWTGRYRGWRETTREGRERFEEEGRRVWAEMEELRGKWEARLGPVGVEESGEM